MGADEGQAGGQVGPLSVDLKQSQGLAGGAWNEDPAPARFHPSRDCLGG